jgi:hypothetical protein
VCVCVCSLRKQSVCSFGWLVCLLLRISAHVNGCCAKWWLQCAPIMNRLHIGWEGVVVVVVIAASGGVAVILTVMVVADRNGSGNCSGLC